jgi:hypothetical protein
VKLRNKRKKWEKFIENFSFLIELEIDSSEILIKNIKYSSKLQSIYCQISNGYGAAASRIFKINVRRKKKRILFNF